MAAQRVKAGGSVQQLPAHVAGYTRRVTPAVLEQHAGSSVSSALGVWLLLAACAPAAQGDDRVALEEALGCPADEAGRLLAAFLAEPAPALHAAIALWVAAGDATTALSAWARALPDQVETGFMPSQSEADAWADRETRGLISRFPMAIDAQTRIVLASALATKVSWEVPFDVVASAGYMAGSSPWTGAVSRLLWDGHPEGRSMIARTDAAGMVAVHCAAAREGVSVVSVSAGPEMERVSVVNAAHEVAATACGDWGRGACSLCDLPLGPGHSWEISERDVAVYGSETRLERITGVALPAWSVRAKLDLTQSALFAANGALESLRQLVGPRPDDRCEAVQTAVASFTRYGFEAAAVSALGVSAAALRRPSGHATERTAVLRFDHPYAALAIAGRAAARGAVGMGVGSEDAPFPGLPLFTAWVADPEEPEDGPPPS